MIKSYGQVIFCFSPSLSLFLKGSTIPNSFHGNLKSFLISRLLLKKQFLKGIKPSIVYLGERQRQRDRDRETETERETERESEQWDGCQKKSKSEER